MQRRNTTNSLLKQTNSNILVNKIDFDKDLANFNATKGNIFSKFYL